MSGKPTLLVLATGGTIASHRDESGAVVPAVAPEELLAGVPGLDDVAEVAVEELSRVNGWNVTPPLMVAVAERARAAVTGDRFDGVVVTHGTDTIEETLYMVDLLAGDATGQGAIAFAGAMRFATDLGADGPRNLLTAAHVAGDPHARGRGALLCVNDEVHAARWVTKTDSQNVSTFRSPPAGPVGFVENGRPRFQLPTPPRPRHGSGVEYEVALAKAYSGMDPALVGWLVERGARGLVVEGTGAGHVPGPVADALERAIDGGVPVVITTRCWTGRTAAIYGGPGGGVTLDRLGVIRANGLNGPKARLALMVALGVTRDHDELRDWFAGA